MSYTKSPWKARMASKGTSWYIEGPYGQEDWLLAEVCGRDLVENSDNANLISAAPDMYEALLEAVEEICNHEAGHTKQFVNIRDKMAAAIAKAEGLYDAWLCDVSKDEKVT